MAYNDSTPSHETHYNQATLRAFAKQSRTPHIRSVGMSTVSTVYGYLFIYL